jgi:glycosyltransferase involved in cell wall biosynthesis
VETTSHGKALSGVTDRIVCVSTAVRDHLINIGRLPSRKMTVIPNAIDTTPFDLVAPRKIGAPARLIAVGRLARVKGHEIKRALKAPDLDQKTKAARNRVKRRYGFSRMVAAYLHLYADCSPGLNHYLQARHITVVKDWR